MEIWLEPEELVGDTVGLFVEFDPEEVVEFDPEEEVGEAVGVFVEFDPEDEVGEAVGVLVEFDPEELNEVGANVEFQAVGEVVGVLVELEVELYEVGAQVEELVEFDALGA